MLISYYYKIEILKYYKTYFTVSFDQFNISILNKIITLKKQYIKKKLYYSPKNVEQYKECLSYKIYSAMHVQGITQHHLTYAKFAVQLWYVCLQCLTAPEKHRNNILAT